MAVWAVKREDETNEKLIKRWKRQTNNARIINEMKGKRYQKNEPTKRIVREAAIKRTEYQEKARVEMFYA